MSFAPPPSLFTHCFFPSHTSPASVTSHKDEAFSYDHYSTTGIIEVEDSDVDSQQSEAIFAPDGKRLTEPRNGLNIIRLKNGKVIKTVKGLQTFAN